MELNKIEIIKNIDTLILIDLVYIFYIFIIIYNTKIQHFYLIKNYDIILM